MQLIHLKLLFLNASIKIYVKSIIYLLFHFLLPNFLLTTGSLIEESHTLCTEAYKKCLSLFILLPEFLLRLLAKVQKNFHTVADIQIILDYKKKGKTTFLFLTTKEVQLQMEDLQKYSLNLVKVLITCGFSSSLLSLSI